MSAFTPLAAILGIIFGGVMMYLYLGRVNKKLLKEAVDYLEKNPDLFNTLESETVDRVKKEGEIPKENLQNSSAPSSFNNEEDKQ